MFEMVEERRNGNKGEGRHDLFSCLLDATLDESNSDALLSDEELVGDSPLRLFNVLRSHLTLPIREHIHFTSCWT